MPELTPAQIRAIRERALREFEAGKSFIDKAPTPTPTPTPAPRRTTEQQDMDDIGLKKDDDAKRKRLFDILKGLGS